MNKDTKLLIGMEGVSALVEFSAIANYKWSSSLANFFMILPICSVVMLIATSITDKQQIELIPIVIISLLSIMSLMLYVWARCYYSLNYFRKIEKKKFQDMLYEAQVNSEINELLQESM
jgi:uncharacterized membrane protein